jgi:hypothetical protein
MRLFAKFCKKKQRQNSSQNLKSLPSSSTIQITNNITNIRHSNDVYIFTNSVIIPSDPGKAESPKKATNNSTSLDQLNLHYDIVTDQKCQILQNNPMLPSFPSHPHSHAPEFSGAFHISARSGSADSKIPSKTPTTHILQDHIKKAKPDSTEEDKFCSDYQQHKNEAENKGHLALDPWNASSGSGSGSGLNSNWDYMNGSKSVGGTGKISERKRCESDAGETKETCTGTAQGGMHPPRQQVKSLSLETVRMIPLTTHVLDKRTPKFVTPSNTMPNTRKFTFTVKSDQNSLEIDARNLSLFCFFVFFGVCGFLKC